MKDIILLTKILFKGSSNRQKNSKSRSSFGKIILFGLLYVYLAGIIAYISYEAINALIEIKQEAVFLNMCFIGILGISFIQTLFSGLNILFFSKDIEYLLPLPIKPIKIVMAKFNCLIITQYIVSTILVLPVIIVYGYLLNLGITFYLMGILIMLLFPIIPVILVTILITIIMKFTNIIKNKDMVQYITVFLTLVFVIAIQFISGAGSEEITNEQMANMLVEANGMLELFSNYFITLKPTINALLNYNSLEGILNIAILFAETVFVYILGAIITSKMYIKAVTSIMTNGDKKTKKINKAKDYGEKSVFKAYVKKEFVDLNRNPIFFMQCVLPSFLFPIIFSVPIFVSFKDMTQAEIQELINMIPSFIETSKGLLVAFGIGAFCFMFNFIALTAISRDRNNSTFMKYIPIDLEKQCFYKIMPGIILNLVPIIYFSGMLKVLIPEISIKVLSYIIIDLILMNICNNYIMIIIDLKNPKLDWITEYAVVKQNINMLFQIIILLIEMAVIAGISTLISNINIFILIIGIIYVISIFAVRKYITKNQTKLFRKVI